MEITEWSVWTHPIVGGEAVEVVGDRADSVIGRVAHAAGDVVLFAHGHFLRILAVRWLGLPADEGRHLALNTATVSTLGYEREHRVIRSGTTGVTCAASKRLRDVGHRRRRPRAAGANPWAAVVRQAMMAERTDIALTHDLVGSVEGAEGRGFHGSPSILVDGIDVFANEDAAVGLSCLTRHRAGETLLGSRVSLPR